MHLPEHLSNRHQSERRTRTITTKGRVSLWRWYPAFGAISACSFVGECDILGLVQQLGIFSGGYKNMIGRIYHVGLTVSDLDRSIAFYRDILGLEFQGEIFMEGEETDKMFRKSNCKARVAYLNGSKAIETPPVELIQFVDSEIHKEQSDLFTTSISEVCFYTDDIDSVYNVLIENHVECLSEPQYFDFRANGFGESRAFYFRDPDGIILEMMQPL
jgi:glyoxylase I family protein